MTPKPLFKECIQENLFFIDLEPRAADTVREVLEGLNQTPKRLSPKFFYDEKGRSLFDEICQLPEYYLTRCGLEILRNHGPEMAEAVGPHATVVEYGSGNPDKAASLLRALHSPKRYVSIDIAKSHLLQSCETVADLFPAVEVVGVCADFNQDLLLHQSLAAHEETTSNPLVGFFPGSSIGNFTPEEAYVFLRRVAADLGPQGSLLIAVDLVKKPKVLHDAYNDARGITAAFNKNMLVHLNHEVKANFNPARFDHYAFFNPVQQRIEMHLVSLVDQNITVAGQSVHFKRGETLHTENSYKYTPADFEALLVDAGFAPEHTWLDEHRLFSYYFCRQSLSKPS